MHLPLLVCGTLVSYVVVGLLTLWGTNCMAQPKLLSFLCIILHKRMYRLKHSQNIVITKVQLVAVPKVLIIFKPKVKMVVIHKVKLVVIPKAKLVVVPNCKFKSYSSRNWCWNVIPVIANCMRLTCTPSCSNPALLNNST